MDQQTRLLLVTCIITCFLLQIQGADKYTDEKRPYEFGFSIDGQQHRHEKKDKNGIIMGEFGFITADDVYHVTVYATDENGRFKILSMKNIHLKASPGTSAREGHSLQFPPASKSTTSSALPSFTGSVSSGPGTSASQPLIPEKARDDFKPVVLQPPRNSCSSCSIPTTTKAPERPLNPYSPNTNYQKEPNALLNYPNQRQNNNQNYLGPSSQPNFSNVKQNGLSGTPVYSPSQGPEVQPPFNTQPNFPIQSNNVVSPPFSSQNQFGSPPRNYQGTVNGINGQQTPVNTPSYAQQGPFTASNYPQQNAGVQSLNAASPISPSLSYPKQSSAPNSPSNAGQPAVSRSPKQYFAPSDVGITNAGSPPVSQSTPKKPTLVSAQMQIVDKNTDIYSKRPGERDGLPQGLHKDDMERLLYTFNYTLGFQAHFEEGYSNGFKQGYYYVTGRNGVRTRIDYTADDTGFHPKISSEVLDLLSDDVPKPETEREARFGLKGYEFKWLYYPVEDKH